MNTACANFPESVYFIGPLASDIAIANLPGVYHVEVLQLNSINAAPNNMQ